MAHSKERPERGASAGGRQGGARRLIAGLRVTRQDEALLAAVRPYVGTAASEGELAYRLWRRGLEVTLAEAVGLGAAPPPGASEELIASLAAQRLLLCLPLLRRTGRLDILGIEAPTSPGQVSPTGAAAAAPGAEIIDRGASDAVAGLGGTDFL